MKDINKSEYKIYGAIAGFFVMVIVGFIFVIFPIIRGIVRDSDIIQEKRIELKYTEIARVAQW